MNPHIKIYEIPAFYSSDYIERDKIENWKRLDEIDHNKACVIVFNDCVLSYNYRSIVVCYKGMMQPTGSGGLCDNPLKVGFKSKTPPNVYSYMGGWVKHDNNVIWKKIIAAKWELLKKSKGLFLFYSSNINYINGMYGLLAGQLDLIGLGKADVSILVQSAYPRPVKLLTM